MGGLTESELAVASIERWLSTQLHLPQIMDENLLQRFVKASKGDLERTKKLIELNYTIRNNNPHLFLQRDPFDEATKKMFECTDMIPLPDLTPSGNNVVLFRLANFDPENLDFNEAVKLFFMFADLRFITPDRCGDEGGDVPIFDMAGYSLRHLTKVVLSTLRVYMKFTQEAAPVRLKQIHVINCPAYVDKVVAVVKPFIKSEVFKLIRFHVPNSDTLYKDVPLEMLPSDYGGNAPSVAEIKAPFTDILAATRDYLSNPIYWKIDDRKRSKNTKVDPLEGNFRTLSID